MPSHRDAVSDAAPVEGDLDGPQEVLPPGLRDAYAAPGAVPSRAARMGRAQLPQHVTFRELRLAPAPQPAGERFARKGCAEHLDLGRTGRPVSYTHLTLPTILRV